MVLFIGIIAIVILHFCCMYNTKTGKDAGWLFLTVGIHLGVLIYLESGTPDDISPSTMFYIMSMFFAHLIWFIFARRIDKYYESSAFMGVDVDEYRGAFLVKTTQSWNCTEVDVTLYKIIPMFTPFGTRSKHIQVSTLARTEKVRCNKKFIKQVTQRYFENKNNTYLISSKECNKLTSESVEVIIV